MLSCNTICPKCQHQFACCLTSPPLPTSSTTSSASSSQPINLQCCQVRRSFHVLSGGGLITETTTTTPTLPQQQQQPLSSTFTLTTSCQSPQVSPSVPLSFVLPPFTTTATSTMPNVLAVHSIMTQEQQQPNLLFSQQQSPIKMQSNLIAPVQQSFFMRPTVVMEAATLKPQLQDQQSAAFQHQASFLSPQFITTQQRHHQSLIVPNAASIGGTTSIVTRPEVELKRLTEIVRVLRMSDWYYEGITYWQSQELLKDNAIGSFLVRDSSDPNFLFSLSVQTDRGPTSVRLHYCNGYFRLDAQTHIQASMPTFPTVLELIEYYVDQCKCRKKEAEMLSSKNGSGDLCYGGVGAQVWVDQRGKVYSSIFLDRPLRKNDSASSLKHLCRLAVHRAIKRSYSPKLKNLPPAYTLLELPTSVKNYLAEYPYSI